MSKRTTNPDHEKAGTDGLAHAPTPATRKQVELQTAVGQTQANVARLIGIDPKTLRKHYRDELDLGTVKANAAIAGKLFSMAMDGNVPCLIFWLKARAGWRDRPDPSLAVSAGEAPGQVVVQIVSNGATPEDEGLITADDPIDGYGRDEGDSFDTDEPIH